MAGTSVGLGTAEAGALLEATGWRKRADGRDGAAVLVVVSGLPSSARLGGRWKRTGLGVPSPCHSSNAFTSTRKSLSSLGRTFVWNCMNRKGKTGRLLETWTRSEMQNRGRGQSWRDWKCAGQVCEGPNEGVDLRLHHDGKAMRTGSTGRNIVMRGGSNASWTPE